MKTIEQHVADLEDLVQYLPDKHKHEARNIFYKSYDEHKEKYGSFKKFSGEAYHTKMRARQDYMIDRVKEYIDRLQR